MLENFLTRCNWILLGVGFSTLSAWFVRMSLAALVEKLMLGKVKSQEMLFGSSGWDLSTRRLKAPLLIGTAEKKTRSSDCLLLQVHGAKAALDVAFQFLGF